MVLELRSGAKINHNNSELQNGNTIVENNANREILLEISACGRPFSFVGSSGSLLQTREKFSN